MSPHAYTEANLVEAAAEEILADLGWTTVSAAGETFGPGGTLGRDTPREAALAAKVRAALERLNPAVPREAIAPALDELLRDRSAMEPAAANREVYRLITEGVRVAVKDTRTGKQVETTLRVVDWVDPSRNEHLAVRQLVIRGPLYGTRLDVALFVNGLPWVVIELKKPGVAARVAFDDNLTSYKHPQNGVPALLPFNGFLVASNGTDSRVGSLTADWDRFFQWKRIASEDEPRRVSLEVLLRGTCDPARLLDLVRNFSLFSAHGSGLAKVLGQNHQVLGVNNAIAATLAAREAGHGRAGVFWQTQGSGKSFSMVFYAQKILRTVPGNWTFVVVTDRVELDDQIARTFAACGAVEDATACHATSATHLRQLLGENHRYVFTLIQKFRTFEAVTDRRDIIVIVDEAHRSQYDQLAMNMRAALPNALFVAFTGTPLIAGERRTREVFGDYVSVYDFQQSVEDGATVPLYYENRTPELKLVNPDLNDELYDVIDDAGLDGASEARLEKLLGQRYHLLTRDDRLDTVAEDIVQHFLGRGFQGKAMVVSIDKATALRMHDKVKLAWAAEAARVRQALRDYGLPVDERARLTGTLRRLDEVDMALIVSAAQNEIEDMKRLGLDIVPHRTRLQESNPPLADRFKDPSDHLEIVFVCAMWLTGFDAPSCSTVYLDKPMKNHTLMQTIARANRVFPGKHSGVIVDYANVFASLQSALALYGTKGDGERPAAEKSRLADELERALAELSAFCGDQGIDLDAIDADPSPTGRLRRVNEAAEALAAPEAVFKTFQLHVRLVESLYGALRPHARAFDLAGAVARVTAIYCTILDNTGEGADAEQVRKAKIADVLRRIGVVLDRSIEGVQIAKEDALPIDLSRLDFKALAARFAQSKTKKLDVERLKAAIRAQLDRIVAQNPTRADLREAFDAMVKEYNDGRSAIEHLFEQLVQLSQGLTEEETRHARENLTPDELVVFDLLTRPGPDLSATERDEVKRVARELLAKLRAVFTVDWQKTQQSRARVKEAIASTLDDGLPRAYTPELFDAKTGAVFEHVVERYGRAA